MSSPKDIAAAFTVSGVLDANTETRRRFPVSELAVADIADHPNNVVYSMDEGAIRRLADSIKADGLTDIPLVRKLADGSFQMISGHRRKAAYALLAEADPAYAKMPCRIIEGISDSQAATLLHTANYFVRELSVTERAAATRALGLEVERMREIDPALSGMRTEDIKAEIITAQTGRKVSGKSIQRQEALADSIENELAPCWRGAANAGELSGEAVKMLAGLTETEQESLHESWLSQGVKSKRQTTDFIRQSIAKEAEANAHLLRAADEIRRYLRPSKAQIPKADRAAIEGIVQDVERLQALIG